MWVCLGRALEREGVRGRDSNNLYMFLIHDTLYWIIQRERFIAVVYDSMLYMMVTFCEK